MNRLLFEDRITPCPHYASVILGSEDKAMFLQQLYYWLTEDTYATKVIDGVKWVKCTYQRWLTNFRWWSDRKLRRVINALEAEGFIYSQECNANFCDRTKMYSINFYKIVELQQQINEARELDEMKFTTPKTKMTNSEWSKEPTQTGHFDQLSIKSIDKKYLKTAEANASALSDREDIKEKPIGEKTINENMSKETLLEKITLSVVKKKSTKINKPKDFEKSFVRIDLWNSLLLEYEYKDITVNAGSKSSGQLKHLYGYCTKAKVDFGEFLTFCVKNWVDVSYYISMETNTAYKRLRCPELGYLVQFFDHAYTYLARSLEKPVESIAEPLVKPPIEPEKVEGDDTPVLFHSMRADKANYGKAIDLEPESICHFGNHAHKHELKRYNGWWYIGDKKISTDLVATIIALKSGKYGSPMAKLRLYDTCDITFDYDLYLLNNWEQLRAYLQTQLDETF